MYQNHNPYANQNPRMVFPVNLPLIDPRSGNPPPFPYFINPIHQFNGPFLLPPPFLRASPEVDFIADTRTRSLLNFLVDEGVVPSLEEETKRQNVIDKLREIVMLWIKTVAHRNGVSSENISSVSASILTYGSCGLGVHNSKSDIDVLCVGPLFATLEDDFFVVLHDMLITRPEVSEVYCIKDAKVPLMRFKLDGISIDLPFAKLKVNFVPENVDLLNPFFLKDIDETSWRSLSGVHTNKCILHFVSNLEAYQSLLRCIKLWAKKRGVYGNLFGFFGGVHLAILTAFICQMHPNASLTSLVTIFFSTFAFWPWPNPVSLQDGFPQLNNDVDKQAFMPIRLPCRPHEFCHSNITLSTFHKIRQELNRGHNLCKNILEPNFDWACLFEAFSYTKEYTRFVKICISACDTDELREWTGWIKSRFHILLDKLESIQGLCDPNPTEHFDINMSKPNVVFYWGLQPEKNDFVDIISVRNYFLKCISNSYRGPIGKITISVLQVWHLPKNAQADDESKSSI